MGEYRIADLPPGKYIVSAFPSKNLAPSPNPSNKEAAKEQLIYLTTYFPGTSDKRQAFVVEVSAGSNVPANFAVQSGRAYRVSGTVTGLPPEPAPQSRSSSSPETDFADVVMASAGGGRGQPILVGADGPREEQNLRPDGSFEFPSVLAGTYRAQIIVLSGFFNGQLPSLKVQNIRTPVEVNGADVIGLNLQLDPTGTVSGRFRADGNEKIDWRQLSVGLQNLPSTEGLEIGMFVASQHSLVGEDGSFEIKDVPAGNYQFVVGAHSNKFRDYFSKSVPLGGQEVADTGFAVNSATVLDVLVSAKGANIEGTVLNSEGKPAAGATVVTVPNSGKLGRPDSYQSDRTDERGHFVLRGLNPGAFTVLAFEEVTEDYRAPAFAKKYQNKGESVDLEESARKSVALKLIPVGSDAQ